MLPSLPAQPLLSLLFPDPGGQPIDLARLEQRLEAAGQLRYARLPWVPGGGGAAAAPQLAVLHSSFSSEERQPVAALVHGGKLLCMTRDGARGLRLQLWDRDQLGAAVESEEDLRQDPRAHADEGRSDDELVAEPAAATNGARTPATAALGAAAAAAQGSSTSRDPVEAEAAPDSAWRRVEGADFELPEEEGELSIAATPNQAGRIVLVLNVQHGQQAQHGQHGQHGQQSQQGQQDQQGQPSRGQSTAAAADPLVLVYDAERQRWSGLQRAALFELSSLQSGCGSGGGSSGLGSGGGGNSVASAARLPKGVPSEPWWIEHVTNPTMACSDFFKNPSLPGMRGPAARAAAAAGLEAMEAARTAACKSAFAARSAANGPAAQNGSAEDVLASQWRQAVALAVDGRDSMVAVWRDWGLPQRPRLGEIAAPETLPYDLRHAQVVRALAAGAAGTAGAVGAAGTASSSGGSSSHLVLLRIAADPSLPPIACALSAAAQCGELCRLLEVLGEGGQTSIGEQQQQQQQQAGGQAPLDDQQQQQRQQQQQQPLVLPLAGVAPEEHTALRQLVGCLSGRTHAGLLESTLLLDVARLADLLDAPALLRECLAALGCVVPGPETFAPLLALAEGRQYHAGLQHLKLFYRHALALHILEGRQPLLGWALHGLRAGVDSVVEVCTDVAARWLPQQPELYLGSPAGDLEAVSCTDWKLAMQQRPDKLRPLLEALLPLWRRQLDAAELAPGGPQEAKRSKAAAGGPFQSAAVRPPQPKPASLSDAALQQEAGRLLQQLQRTLPRQRKREREARTAAAFEEASGGAGSGSGGWAAAEARARRHRLPG